MDQMFIKEEVAVKELKSISSDEIERLTSVRFKFTTELYHRYLMKAVYMFDFFFLPNYSHSCRKRMRGLLEKARVPLDHDKGRVLIGIMDETGILEPGEVFIQISRHINNPSVDPWVVDSQIVIIKNPAVHPGDARRFQGTDVPELHHLIDVVVFPNHGDRPHPNELSGSDLDGDQYHCIWDPRLVPTVNMHEPMDYAPAEKEVVEGRIGKSHMIKHICAWISNDTLGMIDNTHLALADQKPEGIESDVCLELARRHALAVDAPKTGKWQRVDAEIRSELRQYPDFMMKADKPSYPSPNVLGEMFRKCSKFMSDAASPPGTLPKLNDAFKVDGHKDYVKRACQLFTSYNIELKSIMQMFGIETEEEIISGSITTVYPRLRDEIEDVQKTVRHMMKKIKNKYRSLFEKEVSGKENIDEQRRMQACAWYLVTYSRKHGDTYKKDQENRRFLSFPWIVSDVLADIYGRNTQTNDYPCRSQNSEISESIKDLFQDTIKSIPYSFHSSLRYRSLFASYDQHKDLSDAIDRAAHRFGRCIPFGSSALMLYDESEGDVNLLMVRPRNRHPLSVDNQFQLLQQLKNECRSLFSASIVDDVHHTLRVKVNQRRDKTRATITADMTEAYIWIVIKHYIFQNAWLFPVLKLLSWWIFSTGLVGSRNSLLSEHLVPLMFINHCLFEGKLTSVNLNLCRRDYDEFCRQPLTVWPFGHHDDWKDLLQQKLAEGAASSHQGSRTGDALMSFMRTNKITELTIHKDLKTVLRKEKWTELELKEHLHLLSAEMEKASHRLSIHVTAAVLLTKIPVERLFFIEMHAAKMLAGDEDALTRTLRYRSGARIEIRTKSNGKEGGMIVKGKGTEAELLQLKKHIEALNQRAKAERDSKRLVRVRGLKDVTNAHNMLVEGATEEHGLIRLEQYLGFHHPQHDHKSLYVVRLRRPRIQSNVDSTNSQVFDQFRTHFKHQMNQFRRNYDQAVYGKQELNIKFGRSYVVTPPRSFVEDPSHLTADELTKALERRKTRTIDPLFDRRQYRRRHDRDNRVTEGNISTSFVASVALDADDRRNLVDELCAGRHRDDIQKVTDKGVKVVLQTGTGVVTAIYSKDLKELICIENAPVRWVVTDLKRQCRIDRNMVEGNECDIRWIVKTQLSDVGNIEDNALASGLKDAIFREDGRLRVKDPDLDIEFMDDYVTYSYEMEPIGWGIACDLVIRESLQYSRRIGEGRFAAVKEIKEVRLVPNFEAVLDSATMETALEALWKKAFDISEAIKCQTNV